MDAISGPKLRKRRVIRRKDARKIREEANIYLPEGDTSPLSQAELEDGAIVYITNDIVFLVRRNNLLYPTLKNPTINKMPSVVIDMGAIPYICNGADVMAPGIIKIQGEFKENSIIVIKDITYGKALAIGQAINSSAKIREMEKGKVIKTLHHVGDEIWNIIN
jgi:PUA domain protein